MRAKPPHKTQWVKGQSGNPSGKGKADLDVRIMARTATKQAINALIATLKSSKHSVPAAIALLDRGWGKPTQPIEGDLGFSGLLEVLERRRKRSGV